MLLADAATPNANSVWVVILAISALGGNLATIGIWLSSKKKQQTEVSFSKEFPTKKEFDEQRKHCTERHGQLFAAIDALEKASGATIEQKMDFARREIVEVGKKVAGLEATTDLQSQSLAGIQSDVKRILERLPRKHE